MSPLPHPRILNLYMFTKLFTTAQFVLITLFLSVFTVALAPAQTAHAACSQGFQEVSIGFEGAVQQNGNSWCVPINQGGPISQNPIIVLLRGIVQFMVGGVGLVVVGGIIYGGFLYMTARGNSAQVTKAQETIRNAVIGLLMYIFAFAVLNFVIPGGILN